MGQQSDGKYLYRYFLDGALGSGTVTYQFIFGSWSTIDVAGRLNVPPSV